MKKKTIQIKCKGSRLAKLSGLKVIQGELKRLSPENALKLRRRIERVGFDAPFFVWRSQILDGTQRYKVLQRMIEEGWVLRGGVVPVCDITAKNLSEAKDRLLGYVSQYGRVTGRGMSDFLKTAGKVDLKTIDIPNMDMAKLLKGIEGISDNEEEPEYEFTEELLEAQNYVVFAFDSVLDWQVVVEKLGIKPAKALDSRKGYNRAGTGRVLTGKALLGILGE